MKAVEFCYWLQGLFELSPPGQLDSKQTDLIQRHLAMVFKHDIDPGYGQKAAQEVLNAIHNAPKIGGEHPFDPNIKFRC